MNIWVIFNSLGAVALFIFGMKIMSDGVQRASGKELRKTLNTMTRDRFRAFFAGLTLTGIIQSSSAVSVLTLSFVNAGLLNLLRAFAIIVGANIGTTITLWLVGIGLEINLRNICLPLIALALPFYLTKNPITRGWATFVIGFSLIFVGLGLLQSNLSYLMESQELINYLHSFQTTNYWHYLFYILIGLMSTVLLQSSSASTAIISVLFGMGFPLELAAAMIIGANIGTTVTAQIASSVGNIYTKITAHFHTFFNVVGAFVFFFLIDLVINTLEKIIPGNDPLYILAAFHTFFNVATAVIIFPFIGRISQFAQKRINTKSNIKSGLKMMHSPFSASPEMFIYEANNKLIYFAGNIKQSVILLGRLITESDEEKFNELHQRILHLENDGDHMEADIEQYLNHIYEDDLTGNSSKKIHQILIIAQHLENIGDLANKTAFVHKERRVSNSFITPKLRTHLIEIQDVISSATTHLVQNLNELDNSNGISQAKTFENRINELYDEAHESLLNSIEKEKIKPLSAIFYKELIQNYEIIGDHIYKANLALQS